MRISSLIAFGDTQLYVSDADDNKTNWITVITGINGSKKSVFLRMISSAVMGASGVSLLSHLRIPIRIDRLKTKKEGRVIAIAGTAFDRFIRNTSYRVTSADSKYNVGGRYTYLGLRASNGSVGPMTSSKTLGYLLWKHKNDLKTRSRSLHPVLNFLSISKYIVVKMATAPRISAEMLKRGDEDTVKPGTSFTRLRIFLETLRGHSKAAETEETAIYLQNLLSSRSEISRLLVFLQQFPAEVKFELIEGSAECNFDTMGFDIPKLLTLGVLSIADLAVNRSSELPDIQPLRMSSKDLSSGQWQLLLGLLGLGLEIESNSLVLIDEPENSLHPEWQRKYVKLLENTLARVTGCHVIIATHSPLIASGVNKDTGNINRLTASEENPLGIVVEKLSPTFGWEADDSLKALFDMETTRDSSFVELADRALELISVGNTNTDKFRKIADSVIEAGKSLPKTDPMLTIVKAIRNIAGRTGEAHDGD